MLCYWLFCIVFLSLPASGAQLLSGPDPDCLEQQLLHRICQAHKRIWVAVYQLSSAPCVHALVAAKKRGVDVKIILDAGMVKVPVYPVIRRQLARGDISCFILHDHRVMHHKWAVIDNTVWVGSANWTRSGLCKNRELCLVLDAPVQVQLFVTQFLVLCRQAVGISARAPAAINTLFFMPEHRHVLKKRLQNALATAKHHIMVSMYSLTSRWYIQALHDALCRGVNVLIIVEQSQVPRHSLLKQMFARNGVLKVSAAPGQVLHTKSMIIDTEVWLGSMNATAAGMQRNHESMVVFNDPALVAQARTAFDALWQRC